MIYITLGDPFSVNIECLSHLLKNESYNKNLQQYGPTVIIGSYSAWVDQSNLQVEESKTLAPSRRGIFFYNLDSELPYEPNLNSTYRGKLARLSLEKLKNTKLRGSDAVLSCPVDKKLTFAGEGPGGQTEFFEKIAKKQALMTLASPGLSVGLVTNHISLDRVTQTIDRELLWNKLKLFCSFLLDRYNTPRIAICSLNPHCGDRGLFGSEDDELIAPAIADFLKSQQGGPCEIFGPLPADTLFWQGRKGRFHGILAMYHDQGLAPIKAIAFDKTVNISAGLGFLRLSPAHGPASDIFKKGVADSSSFEEALKITLDYTKTKSHE